jgi:uncharacterized protein (TIGR03437 family)
MDVSKLRFHGVNVLVTLIALTIGAGTMRANNTLLNSTPTVTGSVTCSPSAGPGLSGATVTVKPATALTGTATITVTFVQPTGLVVTPASVTLAAGSPAAGLSFSVNAAPGCVGLSPTSSFSNTIQFKTSTSTVTLANDATAAVSSTYTNSASPLVAPAVTVYCSTLNGNHVPSSSGTPVSVTSAANGGTPFTITGTSASWISVGSATGGTASGTAATFTAYAAGTCNSGVGTTGTITLQVLPPEGGNLAVTTSVTVTLVITSASPLTVAPTSISMSHVKGSGAVQTQNVSVTSSVASTYFTLNTTTLPIWLTVNSTYAFAPASLTFSTTSVADTMAPGAYSATVYLQVYGSGDLPIPVTLFVTNAAPKLSISSANPLNITWVQGSAPPTATITAISSDSPIPYSTSVGGTLAPIVNATEATGLAYSFGTSISVTFPAQVYQTVQPGTVITGTVSFTWGSPATITIVTINLTVSSPGAALTSLSPATIPTAVSPASFPVVLSGSGFVASSNPALSTKVGIVVGGVLVADSNLSLPNVVNPSNIIETITVPTTTDALLPFAPAGSVVNGQTVVGGQVILGVCNGNCVGTVIPLSAQFILTIGGGPVIQGVTSSSSFIEVTPPALPSVAPYDMISIFGVNFCSSGGSGCATNTLLSNSPTGATMQYGATLSPDPVSATQRILSVSFMPHGSATPVFSAPLLFATNGQINAMVPGGLTTGSEYDIVVSFGYGTTTNLLKSPAFPVNVVTSDPGIFTIGSDGQGGAAALENSTGALITSAAPAGLRAITGANADSDVLQIYMTGLGAPTSTYNNANTGTSISPTDCVAATSGTGNYMGVLNTAAGTSLTNIDGAVIQSSLLNTGVLAPCFTTEPTVKIGGVAGTVTYAGFVPNSIAGLYQIDVQLPASTATYHPDYPLNVATPLAGIVSPVQLPVQVTINSITTQSGVTLWVEPKLNVEAPTLISGTVGVSWGGSCGTWTTLGTSTGNCVIANPAEATGAVHYAITSGVLPAGLSLNAITGVISGIPGANSGGTYLITVTATDSAAVPVSGTVSFAVSIAADLYLSSTSVASYTTNWTATLNTTSATINSAVTVTGGTAPYTFSVVAPVPTGMTVNTSGQVEINEASATPAGTYSVTVKATDSAGTPLTGTLNFSLVVKMTGTYTGPTTVTAADTTTTITTVSGHGGSGTYSYTLDASNTASVTLDPVAGTIVNAGQGDGSVNVVVDVTDTGAAPTGGTVAPPLVVTIPITIAL